MIILGFDPGLAPLGYGLIESDGFRHKVLDYGIISTPAGMPTPVRLRTIHTDVLTLIDQLAPEAIAVEELFFNQNVTTAINVAQARGVLLAACSLRTANLYEYTPLQVKQAVAGYGRAEKRQVQIMVASLLKLEGIPRPDDAADALAVAICHAHSGRMGGDFRII